MSIVGFLMVVDQTNIAGGIRLFVVPENQPPVSSDSEAPRPFQVAFKRMQLPARKPSELLRRRGGFKGEQKLAQLVGHRGRHTLGVPIFMKLLEPFMAKADKVHLIRS